MFYLYFWWLFWLFQRLTVWRMPLICIAAILIWNFGITFLMISNFKRVSSPHLYYRSLKTLLQYYPYQRRRKRSLIFLCYHIPWLFSILSFIFCFSILTYSLNVQDPFVNIAPKKPNWDLRRDVQKKLDKLEKRTQKAMFQLMGKWLSLVDNCFCFQTHRQHVMLWYLTLCCTCYLNLSFLLHVVAIEHFLFLSLRLPFFGFFCQFFFLVVFSPITSALIWSCIYVEIGKYMLYRRGIEYPLETKSNS